MALNVYRIARLKSVAATCRALRALGLAIILGAVSLPLRAEKDHIIVGYGEDSFPAYYAVNNSWYGMDVDVITRLIDRADLDAETVSMKFPRIYKAVEMGRVHIAANLSKNETRSTFLDWVGPVRTTSIALITTPDFLGEDIRTYDDLIKVLERTKLKLAYLTGTSFSPSLDALLAEPSFRDHLFFVSENAAAKRMLKAGRVMGFFYDAYEAQAILKSAEQAKKTGFDGLAIHSFRVPGSESGAYIGLSKQMPEDVRAALKQAFGAMVEEGELVKIACKWGAASTDACAQTPEN